MARWGGKLRLTTRACLAFLAAWVDVLGQALCNDPVTQTLRPQAVPVLCLSGPC